MNTEDLKGMCQQRAEEIAQQTYHTDYFELDDDCQQVIWNQAAKEIDQKLKELA